MWLLFDALPEQAEEDQAKEGEHREGNHVSGKWKSVPGREEVKSLKFRQK